MVTTAPPSATPARPPVRPPANGSSTGRRLLGSGWVPAGLAVLAIVVTMRHYQLPLGQLAIFTLYVGLVLTLPGTLWWRLARGRASWLGEDLAAGLCVGYALDVLVYLPARAIGVPKLTPVWAVGTVLAFAAVPRLRRYWRGAGHSAERPPVWWFWAVAVAVGFLLTWSAGTFFRIHPLTGPQTPYVDMMFQLALAGEVKHHIPATMPWVVDEPLNYHWFLYPEISAVSWVTGLEPMTLLYRLILLPMLAAIALLVAITARRITGLWWTGPATLAVFLFSFAPNPFRWAPSSVFDAQSLVSIWTSPTHIFGMTLFSAVTLLVVYLMQGEGERRFATWAVLAILVAGTMGSKATYLPMMVVGLLLGIGAHWLRYRRLYRTGLIALAIVGAGVLCAQFVLLGGSDGALQVHPFATAKRYPLGTLTNLTSVLGPVRLPILVGLTGIAGLCWLFLWSGAFGILARQNRRIEDPTILLLLGIGLAGIGAVLVFEHGGAGQLYFLRGAGPAIALVTVAGFAAVLPAGRAKAVLLATGGGLALGAAATSVMWFASSSTAPKVTRGQAAEVGLRVAFPYLLMIGIVVATAAAVALLRRRVTALRGVSVVLVFAVMLGFGLPEAVRRINRTFDFGFGPSAPQLGRDGQATITADGIDAARWLRAHSSPADLVATNAHCLPTGQQVCDNRNFWISAFAERRVLLEGWGYTDTAHRLAIGWPRPFPYLPYWNKELQAQNDAVFTEPTQADVDLLRDRYGVRWLFAETRYAQHPSTDLGKYATERYRIGNYAVYEIEP